MVLRRKLCDSNPHPAADTEAEYKGSHLQRWSKDTPPSGPSGPLSLSSSDSQESAEEATRSRRDCEWQPNGLVYGVLFKAMGILYPSL